jgi:hypothetical protein
MKSAAKVQLVGWRAPGGGAPPSASCPHTTMAAVERWSARADGARRLLAGAARLPRGAALLLRDARQSRRDVHAAAGPRGLRGREARGGIEETRRARVREWRAGTGEGGAPRHRRSCARVWEGAREWPPLIGGAVGWLAAGRTRRLRSAARLNSNQRRGCAGARASGAIDPPLRASGVSTRGSPLDRVGGDEAHSQALLWSPARRVRRTR